MARVTALVVCLGMGICFAEPGAKESKGDAASGKLVFEQCTMCHQPDSTDKKTGPGLKGLFKRAKMTNGQKVTEQSVRAKVETGGNGMPAYKDMLTPKELNDVIAYLKTL